MPKEDSGNSNLESVKGRIGKPIKAMSFEEQLIELGKDPRFKALVRDIQNDTPDRRAELQNEIDRMASGE